MLNDAHADLLFTFQIMSLSQQDIPGGVLKEVF